MRNYLITMTDNTLQPFQAKGYRINYKNGMLTLWGKRYETLAAYPCGIWLSITEDNPLSHGQAQ